MFRYTDACDVATWMRITIVVVVQERSNGEVVAEGPNQVWGSAFEVLFRI